MATLTLFCCVVIAVWLSGYVECLPKRDKCPSICFLVFNPVCGTNGVTYTNECLLKVAMCDDDELQMEHMGQCDDEKAPCPKVCSFEYRPVCGSDGKTYANKCKFLQAKVCEDQPYLKIKSKNFCYKEEGDSNSNVHM